MSFGYECRSRILKQVPAKPTLRTHPIAKETPTPGPAHYDVPELCGKVFRMGSSKEVLFIKLGIGVDTR